MMNRLPQLAILALVFLSLDVPSSWPQEPAASAGQGAGIAASLVSQSGKADLRWRLLRPELSVSLSAAVNGRPLKEAAPVRYPWAGAKTHVLILLDVSDPRREQKIQRDKITLFAIVNRVQPHDKISIGLYADTLSMVVPKDRNVVTVVNQVAAARPKNAPANLGAVLQRAVELLSKIKADRKAIFVLSDGHSDDRVDVGLLDLMARNVSLSFILTPTERTSDLVTLKELARLTGGVVSVDEATRELFLDNPFALVDSGGRAEYALDKARRYYWEPQARLEVTLRSGAEALVLDQVIPVRRASLGEHLVFLLTGSRGNFSIPATLAVVLGGPGLYFVVRRRRRKAKQTCVATKAAAGTPDMASEVAAGTTADRVETAAEASGPRPDPMPSPEEMWERLKGHLRRDLPRDCGQMTAIEIARAIGTRDARVKQFVTLYYYPRVYGRERGQLSDEEAFSLMNSIAR